MKRVPRGVIAAANDEQKPRPTVSVFEEAWCWYCQECGRPNLTGSKLCSNLSCYYCLTEHDVA